MNYLTGDIWTTERDLLVIPVNCVGVPGKGLALQWAERDVPGVARYKAYCKARKLDVGGILPCGRVLALATKNHWRAPSRLEWVEMGLLRVALFQERTHKSVALPQVGCGLGGLSWEGQVKPLVSEIFGSSPFAIDIYEA